jgi:hypothetical protein
MRTPQLTLDTNLLLEVWKHQNRQSTVERLIKLAQLGVVDLAVTARIRHDVPRPPLCDEIDRLLTLRIREVACVTTLGAWRLGGDALGSDDFSAVSQQLVAELNKRGRKPPDWRDWDHIHAHFICGRSRFLTWDQGILEVAAALHDRLQIRISTPEDWLAEIA